jgi:hypothetical protein
MKALIDNLGLILILGGIIFLGISFFNNIGTNTYLLISLIFIVVGLLSYILTNKFRNV